jgi:hypothetical protein
MLRHLEIRGVGPARAMKVDLGERVNLVTGDNGVGKSFLLDVIWWSLTRTWAAEPARPRSDANPAIEFRFDTRSKAAHPVTASFDAKRQEWSRNQRGRPADPGLVLYAQVDGGFSVWDPARNYYKTREGADPERPQAFTFTRDEVWYGKGDPARPVCNGLVRDWLTWQLEKGEALRLTESALARLAPPDEPIVLGSPAVVSGSTQRVPTLRASNGQEVPITLASAGLRRICALAYLLVWTWLENRAQSQLQKLPPVRDITFLIDELESHLHPRWQRTILGALRGLVDHLLGAGGARVQIVATTHSPLVMVAAEDWFGKDDAWLDLDLVDGEVEVVPREFERRGVAAAWLRSEAFNQVSDRAPETQRLLDEVARALQSGPVPGEQLRTFEERLAAKLGPHDPFWPRWRHLTAGPAPSQPAPPASGRPSTAREPAPQWPSPRRPRASKR